MACILLIGCTDKKADTEGNWNGCVVGMFTADSTASFPGNGENGIIAFEDLIQHQVGSVLIYPTWSDSFPAEECRIISKTGAIPHLTWELFKPEVTYNTAPVDSGGYTMMNEVLAGKYDDYIKKFAGDAKTYKGKVMIRFLHEFNGNWYMWGGRKNGAVMGGPQKVVAVWKHVVDIFRAVGADNVKWVWCPHGPSPDLSLEKW
ncbi:MAG TPA: glycosyl hydrolase, partial [Bacteroidales bacterium]|nr:glycosyl hydrolase [Bacteroidales bacterium]